MNKPRRAVTGEGLPRWFDVTVSVLGIAVFWPLFLLVALLVRLDSPGPILFRQKRVGRGDRLYTCYKFRTMYQDAPPREEKRRVTDFARYVFNPPQADPRVTPIGRVLRKTSLDEIPQLLNVIRGEMALVGPRPEIPELVAQYPAEYHERHRVFPGLTGLAQVNGRANLTYHETMLYDLDYVRNRSVYGDLRILWRTIRVVLSWEGAR